jgi:hypothetical protein
MRLQDAAYTKIILVTLPEVTPVSQAAALQDDLRRASIEPYAWVLNKPWCPGYPTGANSCVWGCPPAPRWGW